MLLTQRETVGSAESEKAKSPEIMELIPKQLWLCNSYGYVIAKAVFVKKQILM